MYKLKLEKADTEKAREFQKTQSTSVSLTKDFDCEDHSKLWKILKEMEIPDYLTCLLRNLYAGQEATELKIAWHHQCNGHEFDQTPGNSGGQRSPASVHGVAESDMI